jgi:DNA-binding LacI/PurR family transcriptional regulator
LKKAGIRFEPQLHFCSDCDPKIIHGKLIEWFSGSHPPTALFSADDQLVPDVYRILDELKSRIPEDVSLRWTEAICPLARRSSHA